MDVVTKSVDAAVNPVESEHPNGEFEVILSTEALDRDDENLWADEWKQPLPARIHIDGDHGRTLEKTVGSAVPRIEGNRMIGKGTYAGTEYAQMVRQLVNEGHINSVSVTYAERKNQKDNSVQRELLNAAFVAIPANPEAVVLASKSAKVPSRNKAMYEVLKEHVGTEVAFKIAENTLTREEARAFFFDKAAGGLSASGDNPEVKHDAMVQAIHDAAYALGAECTNATEADPGTDEGANKSATTVVSKAISGSVEDLSNRVSDAVRALFGPNEWPWVRATFLDGDGGTVVYETEGGETLARSFTDDGTRCTLGSDVRPVSVVTTLVDGKSAKSSSTKDAGSPQETEESTATAEKAAAADESAEDAALTKAKEAEKARALAWLISQNTKD